MKLTIEQIEQLYTFTRQHFVEWYDLQTELVDHLANAIETKWQENPNLTFDEVLNIEFKKFGVFGFMDVVDERRKFLSRKYLKLIWKYYKEFFQLPKIVLTILGVLGIFSASKIVPNPEYFLFGMFVLLIGFSIFELVKKNRILKQQQKKSGKKWLFEEIGSGLNILPFGFLPVQISNGFNLFLKLENWSDLYSFVTAIVIILFGLLIFIQLKIIPNKVAAELGKTYPEYNFLKL